MGVGEEPSLEAGRRQIDPGVQHGVEEGGVGIGVLGLGILVVAYRFLDPEEHAEEVPGGLQTVGDASRVEGSSQLASPLL